MELNNHNRALLVISISSLVLFFCAEATDLSPSSAPSAAPVSHISSSPNTSPETLPDTSPDTSPETPPDTSLDTSPETSPDTSPETLPDTSPSSSPSPTPGGKSEVVSTVESYVKQGAADADRALDFIAQLSQKPGVTPGEAECYDQCLENYGGIYDDFKKAQDDLSSGDLYLLSEDLSAVWGDVDACQECFSEVVGVSESPLQKFDELVLHSSQATQVLEFPSINKLFPIWIRPVNGALLGILVIWCIFCISSFPTLLLFLLHFQHLTGTSST
ncbi:hypothetical protein F0562_000761 [Nyssa sinensis]|uniref:Pectinesterase inhibitor domain-containing protein n=1 Tax=Nyssa sinensis TaxID=561372 RepID=A0A5J5C5A6_9ASTE|nr:hypothetical protein F0562_000761 [Nyssa sinensis]